MNWLRYLGGRRIGGIIIAFTGPDMKDAYGNYWTRDTDLALARYNRRPLYYQHRGDVVEAGYIQIDDLVLRDDGLYMECDVLDNEAGEGCLALVRAGRGHYSTGVMPGSWREAADGWVELWPWVEASVTDHPATKYGLTRASLVYRSIKQQEFNVSGDVFFRRGPVFFTMPGVRSDGQYVLPENAQVHGGQSTQNGQAAGSGALAAGDSRREGANDNGGSSAGPVGELSQAQLEQIAGAVGGVVREALRDMTPARRLQGAPLPGPLAPANVGQNRERIEVRHRYDDLTLAGMALWGNFMLQLGRMKGPKETEFVRALRAKVEQQRRRDDALTDDLLMRGYMRMIDNRVLEDWGRHIRADEAMTSTYVGYGDELVPTVLSSVLWYHFMLNTRVAQSLQRIQMLSNPYEYPIVTGGPVIRRVPELQDQANFGVHNSVIPASKIATSKVTFSAGKIGALVLASSELFEDAGYAVANVWASQMVRQMASAIDHVILHGDETTGINNISHNGADPTGTVYDKILVLDGLRHLAVGDAQTVAQTVITADSSVALRKKMGARGKFGLDPRQLINVVDPNVYYDMLALDAIESIADVGQFATLLTGAVGQLKGVPVIVSDELENTNATGLIPSTHDATLGSHLVVNWTNVFVGYMRDVSTELFKVPGADGYAADVTVRLDLQQQEAGQVAYGYNVGGV